jgi:hypothetical protein
VLHSTRLSILKLAVPLMFLSLVTGCTTTIQRVSDQSLGEKHVFAKNYKVGEKKSVSVGDQMIRVEDYYVEEFSSQVVTPSNSTSLTGGVVSTSLIAGKQYKLRGNLKVADVTYTVADSETRHSVLIKPDGTLHNHVAAEVHPGSGQYVLVIYTMNISNPSVIMTRGSTTKTNQKKGYENYEILYSGKSANSINLTYREYTQDGMARSAFQQPLTYESDATTIAFKKFRITVHKATSSDITFTVIEDGYKR